MNYIGALAVDGKTFNYRTNERLHKALELKLFEDQKDCIKLKNLVSSVVDKETQEKIDLVKDRLMEELRVLRDLFHRRPQLRLPASRARGRQGVEVSLKIHQDHSRFKQIRPREDQGEPPPVRAEGRDAGGKKGRTPSPSPSPSSTFPLQVRHKEQGGVGQGDGDVGQQLSPGAVPAGDGHKAGQGEGDHALEVDVSLEELASILGEELQLPNIERRGKEQVVAQKIKYTGRQPPPAPSRSVTSSAPSSRRCGGRSRSAPTIRPGRSSSPPARTGGTAATGCRTCRRPTRSSST
jgi:hypothetical protein